MKKLLMGSLLFVSACTLRAQSQNTQLPLPPKPELGLFAQTDGYSDNGSISMIGFQYKRWHSEHLGIRVIGGYGQYLSNRSQVQYIANDSSYSKDEQLRINLPILGVGLEAQRHFYKRVNLFAALELRGGYGKGTADTLISIFSKGGSPTPERFGSHDASLLYFGASASIGARIQYKRCSIGLELLPVQGTFTQTAYKGNSTEQFDLNLGHFSERISLLYRL